MSVVASAAKTTAHGATHILGLLTPSSGRDSVNEGVIGFGSSCTTKRSLDCSRADIEFRLNVELEPLVRFTPIPIILTPRRQVDVAAGAGGDEGQFVAWHDFNASQHDASGNDLVSAIG